MKRGLGEVIGGIFLLVVAMIVIHHPDDVHYEAPQPHGRISIAYSDNYTLDFMLFTFSTTNAPNTLTIDYSASPLKMGNGSLAIVIPYDFHFNATNGWQERSFSGETIVFKQFVCHANYTACNSNGRLLFTFDSPISSFRFPKYYIQIPFESTPFNSDVITFINEINGHPNLVTGFNKVRISNLKVIIDKQNDEMNTIPTAIIDSGTTNNQAGDIGLNWSLANNTGLFQANFDGPDQRSQADTRQTILAVVLPSGLGFIFYGITTISNTRDQKRLKNFITISDANFSLQTKNYARAKKVYDRVLAEEPNNRIALNNAGVASSSLENWKEAAHYYQRILDKDPENVPALNNLGLSYKKMNDNENAVATFTKAFNKDPNDYDTLINLGVFYSENLGDHETSVEFFDRIINNEKFAGYLMVEPLVNKAIILEKMNRIDDAIQLCDRVLQIDKENINAINEKGNLLLKTNHLSEAIDCFTKVLKIKPYDATATFNLALTYLQFDEYKGVGETLLREYLVSDPENYQALEKMYELFKNREETIEKTMWRDRYFFALKKLQYSYRNRLSRNDITIVEFNQLMLQSDAK